VAEATVAEGVTGTSAQLLDGLVELEVGIAASLKEMRPVAGQIGSSGGGTSA
jgi:hypothetical protein